MPCTLGENCGCMGEDRPYCAYNKNTDQASSVPPDPKTPGPKPPEVGSNLPPPAEGSFTAKQASLNWLYGFASAMSIEQRTMMVRELNTLEDLVTVRTLDPRVTFSVDYGLADKLGNQLEWLNTAVGVLAKSHLAESADPSIPAQIGDIKRNLEAAIKTCNELGLPF